MEEEQVKPFQFINQTGLRSFFNVIRKEHPQTIALVLSLISPDRASIVIQNLPINIQGDILRRIAVMNVVNAEIVRDIEQVIKEELSAMSGGFSYSGGVKNAVEILNFCDREAGNNIIEALENDDPELAEEIKKNRFVFNDIVKLDDRSVQKVMREVDSLELAKALINVNTEVQDKFFRNMSKRAANMLHEDMGYMGPVRLSDVEEAQQKIINIVNYLENNGEIVITRGNDELVEEEVIKPEVNWVNILSLSNRDIKKIVKAADYQTLLKSLKTASPESIEKFTKPMGMFKRLKFKHDTKRLKNISADETAEAQNKIISIYQNFDLDLDIGDSDD